MDREQRKDVMILDVGCGGGRHIKLFAEQGFRVYGIDFSEEGIEHTRQILGELGLNAELNVGDMRALPYDDDYFDGLVSFGAFYYLDTKGMKQAINESYRVLKKQGKAIIVTRTTDDYRFGKGKRIEKNTYILETDETNEHGMMMHFLSKDDVYEYYSRFSKINIERNEFTINNLAQLNSDWAITVEK
jgi:cyclopropane fatty-acyl-phospholipid synthase-like methyltransferase